MLDGVTEIYVSSEPSSTPESGYIYVWQEGTHPTVTLKYKDSSGNTGNVGSTNDSTAIHKNVSAEISTITEKTTLANDDIFIIEDSAASNAKKKIKAETIMHWEDCSSSCLECIAPKDNKSISVGNYAQGAESDFGEGRSRQTSMIILTYDGSLYADVTTNALIYGSGNYVQFPNLNANSAIYIGTSDATWYSGLKINIIQLLNVGSGSVVKEYWNGTAWIEFTTMATESDFPHQSYGEGIGATLGCFELRYNHRIGSSWVTTNVNGTTTYWTRYRIVTAITQSFRFDLLALHTSRTAINTTGFMEFFGWARPIKQLFLDYGSFQAAASTPTTQDVYLSDYLDVGRVLNEFSATAIQRSGFTKILPLDLDTSTPIKLRIKWYGENATTGDVRFIIRWGVSTSTTGVFSTAALAPATAAGEQSVAGVINVPAAGDYKEIITDMYLSISNYIPEIGSNNAASIWITFERTGSDASDTYAGVVVVVDIECYYLAWRLGGMAVNY